MRLRVSFSLYLPEGTSEDDVAQWLRFHLGELNTISSDNTLRGESLRSIEATDIDWQEC